MSLPRSYRVLTLGCKLNQLDSAGIEGRLRARGFEAAADGSRAGVVVLNTCTVTESADRDARRLARRARRENPGCRLLVAGCYAERDRERWRAMAGIDEVIGHADKDRIDSILDALRLEAGDAEIVEAIACIEVVGGLPAAHLGQGAPALSHGGEIACIEAAGEDPAPHFGERARAFLKVQEGCDLTCSYCIIPAVRGRSRSVEPDRIARGLEDLVRRGYREVVLTGVNTGDYGKDLAPRTTLAALLRRLLRTPGLGRLRLNSLEPRTVTSEIVGLLRDEPGLARHLQVPLQSGSDMVLKAMRRNYRAGDYARVVEGLRRDVPQIGIGADVIVGFPGEEDRHFEETLRFLERSPVNTLHVFSYSDRPGTPASRREPKTDPRTIRARSARLRSLGEDLSRRFRAGFVGRTLPALVYPAAASGGARRALTDNFIDLALEGATSADVNRIVPALVLEARRDRTLARVAHSRGPGARPPHLPDQALPNRA